MNFGQALEKVKAGYKIFRHGWNGKGMFVVYQKGYPDGIPCNLQTAKAWGMNEVSMEWLLPPHQLAPSSTRTFVGSCENLSDSVVKKSTPSCG